MGRRPVPAGILFVMKTYSPKPSDIQRRWYVIDADGAVLGRLASEVASLLKGKHKPIYAPHADTGDHVIVLNAKGIRLTGDKGSKKIAYRHSGYPGGLTATAYDTLLATRPAFAIEKAVKGMLPKNSLGRQMLRKLTVYEGGEHPHAAQQPETIALGQVPKWDGLPVADTTTKAPATKPAKKRSADSEGSTAKPAAKKSTAKRPTGKSTAKSPVKSSTKSSAKKSAAKKSTAKKASTAKRTTKKQGDD